MKIANQKTAAAIIRAQSVGILAFAIVTLVGAITTGEIESWLTIAIEIFIYLFFVIVMWVIARGVLRRNQRAFGPYVLTQLFVLIIAWPLITTGEISTRVLGLIAGLSASWALLIVFSRNFRNEFF